MIHQPGRHLEEWDGRHWHYTARLNPNTGMTEVSISNENNTIKIIVIKTFLSISIIIYI